MASFIGRLLLAGLLLFGPLCAIARADGPTNVIGGTGGSAFEGACGDDGYLVGMLWGAGKDMEWIRPLCQRFENGHAVGQRELKAMWGVEDTSHTFAAETLLACPPDTAVERMGVGVSNVNLVHKFTFVCRNPEAHDYTSLGWAGSAQGETRNVDAAGCGGGAIAVGVIGRYGTLIDALGLLCRTIAAPAPTPPPQKAHKAPRGPPAPAAPSPAAPSGPSLAPRVSIAGMWDLVVNGGDHYRVQIITQGEGIGPNGADVMPIGINGIITNSQGDHQYDGGFTAQLQPDRQMILNYSQKNGGHGTCQFAYSGDGKTLGGTCVDQDNDTFPWTGGRAP